MSKSRKELEYDIELEEAEINMLKQTLDAQKAMAMLSKIQNPLGQSVAFKNTTDPNEAKEKISRHQNNIAELKKQLLNLEE
ncbi:hypothetical protein ACFP1I_13225 [Dyadobacter subterraneus]|uniref:Valyl-tRNA synthetase tRNA-binding arm domain-containing protein n=1 Tax=Dyadobacter subterraneus TaxID=2773304 RepID=A0ABR9W9N0_9BACT|nr:hypothetical protein [Dyadobacter subterraneus]MBE9462194.1 hypothetical protein [Dyadobacter subterraneus]